MKSYGPSTWRDKSGVEKTKYGPLYIHFKEECLKNFDTDKYYGPGDDYRQVLNRQNMKGRKASQNNPTPKVDVEKLLSAQSDPNSLIRSVVVYGDSYLVFLYTDKQLEDIEQFCCSDNDVSVLGIDTTFKLCDTWVTDTSYRNKRVLSTRSKKHPVHLGPVMLHFTKNEETFRRFCAELLSANPQLNGLTKIGVDMESAIFNA